MSDKTDAHGVNEWILRVSVIEGKPTAHRRTSKTVAVGADAGDHSFEEMSIAAFVKRAEMEVVEDGDGTGAHGENITKDAADAGGGPLKGLDRRRMVVRFDLENDRQSVANVDGPRIFARAL